MAAKSELGIVGVGNCTVVHESDGTLVDEDNVLQGCKSAVLMLLKPPQQWQPAALAVSSIGAGDYNGTSNVLEYSASANLVSV
jgi:CIDE-N domain